MTQKSTFPAPDILQKGEQTPHFCKKPSSLANNLTDYRPNFNNHHPNFNDDMIFSLLRLRLTDY